MSTTMTAVVIKQTAKEPKMTPPCDRIPLEIWQNIFLLLLSSEHIPVLHESNINWSTPPPESIRGSLVLPRVPSSLSSVCSHWRSYAYGMPDMWNVLFIKAPRSIQGCGKSPGAEGIVEIVKARLSLSRSMPLKICLASKDNLIFAQSIIRAIIPLCRRWTTIHLYTPRAAYAELRCLRPDDVLLLVSLNTFPPTDWVAENTFNTPDIDQIPFFNDVSSIKQFCTSIIPPPSSSIYVALQELSIQSCRSETWLLASVLSSCSQLRALTLSGYGVTTYTTTDPEAQLGFVLPKLETLVLEHPVGRERLLDLLILPNLKSLWLGGRCCGPSTLSILNSINQLKKRSNVDSLEYLSLSFEMHTMDPTMLIDLLRSNHAIRMLRIDDTFKNFNSALITPCLFDALTKTSTDTENCSLHLRQPLLCSRLRNINLTVSGCSIFEYTELAAFLEARCRVLSVPAETAFGSNYSPAPVAQLEVLVKRPGNQTLHEVVGNWRRKGYFVGLKVVE